MTTETVIRRVQCRRCGHLSESYARPGRCVDDRCNGEMVEVEYVRAPFVPVQRVLHDFAAKLRELDDRNVSTRGNALSHEDPRDLVKRIESMCAGLGMLGRIPGVEHARALGAFALALSLACARVEELDVAAGGEAA